MVSWNAGMNGQSYRNTAIANDSILCVIDKKARAFARLFCDDRISLGILWCIPFIGPEIHFYFHLAID